MLTFLFVANDFLGDSELFHVACVFGQLGLSTMIVFLLGFEVSFWHGHAADFRPINRICSSITFIHELILLSIVSAHASSVAVLDFAMTSR